MQGGEILVIGWILSIFSGFMIVRSYIKGRRTISAEQELKEEKKLRKIEKKELELAMEEENFDKTAEYKLSEIVRCEKELAELEKEELKYIEIMDTPRLLSIISQIKGKREQQYINVLDLEKAIKNQEHRQHKLNLEIWHLNQLISLQRGELTRTMEQQVEKEEEKMKQDYDIERELFHDFKDLANHVKRQYRAVLSREKNYSHINKLEKKMKDVTDSTKRIKIEKKLNRFKEEIRKQFVQERKEIGTEIEALKKAEEEVQKQKEVSEKLEKEAKEEKNELKLDIKQEKETIAMKKESLGQVEEQIRELKKAA